MRKKSKIIISTLSLVSILIGASVPFAIHNFKNPKYNITVKQKDVKPCRKIFNDTDLRPILESKLAYYIPANAIWNLSNINVDNITTYNSNSKLIITLVTGDLSASLSIAGINHQVSACANYSALTEAYDINHLKLSIPATGFNPAKKSAPQIPMPNATSVFANDKLVVPFSSALTSHLPTGSAWSLSPIVATDIKTNFDNNNDAMWSSATISTNVSVNGMLKPAQAIATFDVKTEQYHIYNTRVIWSSTSDLTPSTYPAWEPTPAATSVFANDKLVVPFSSALTSHLPTGSAWSLSPIMATDIKTNFDNNNDAMWSSATISTNVSVNGMLKPAQAIATFDVKTEQYHIYNTRVIWSSTSDLTPSTYPAWEPTPAATSVFANDKLVVPFSSALSSHLPTGSAWSLSPIMATDIKTNFDNNNDAMWSSATISTNVSVNGMLKPAQAIATFDVKTEQYHIYNTRVIWSQTSDLTPNNPHWTDLTPYNPPKCPLSPAIEIFTTTTVKDPVEKAMIKHLGAGKYSKIVINPLDFKTFNYNVATSTSSLIVTGNVSVNGQLNQFSVLVSYDFNVQEYHHNKARIFINNNSLTPAKEIFSRATINNLVKLLIAKVSGYNANSMACANTLGTESKVSRNGNILSIQISGKTLSKVSWYSWQNMYLNTVITYDITTHKYVIRGTILKF